MTAEVISLRDYLPRVKQAEKPRKRVTAYVDGSARPNPGRGAYGVLLRCGTREKPLSGVVPEGRTTNQRAEIHAAIAALEALKAPCEVTIVTDSLYLAETAKGNYKRRTNLDLWESLDNASSTHEVVYRWVGQQRYVSEGG
jgi:ribonuclease HI